MTEDVTMIRDIQMTVAEMMNDDDSWFMIERSEN